MLKSEPQKASVLLVKLSFCCGPSLQGICLHGMPLTSIPFIVRSAKIKDKASEKAQMVLVGSKSDLTGSRVITKEQGEELAQSLGVEYFETSAREDVNVKQTFETLVDLISEKIPEAVEEDLDTVPKDIQLGQPEVKTKKSSGCCCEYCRK